MPTRSHALRFPQFGDGLRRLLALNLLLGLLAALIVVAAILALDTGSLRTLMLRDSAGGVALALLAGGFAATCAGVMVASAVMSLGSQPKSGPGGTSASAGRRSGAPARA